MKTKLNIDIQPGQTIFFTSDLHFGHRNVLRFCQRPWKDEKEMSRGLIQNWNEKVKEEDIVFVLGDFSWWDGNQAIQKLLKQLQGHIYLIPGNHDSEKGFRELPNHVELLDGVVTLYLRGLDPDKPNSCREIVLSHYPLMTWPHREKGVIQLHGHVHSGPRSLSKVDTDLPYWKGQQYDVGVDNNEYYPVSLEEIDAVLKDQVKPWYKKLLHV